MAQSLLVVVLLFASTALMGAADWGPKSSVIPKKLHLPEPHMPPKRPMPPKHPMPPMRPKRPMPPMHPMPPMPHKRPMPPMRPKRPMPPKPHKEKCRNKTFKHCYNIPIECPWTCPRNCYINCLTCSPVCQCNVPGAVCKDPRFIGADGITFYFHGKKDRDFCLFSDSDLHINAHFIGRRGVNMSRDFTWVQSIGILFGDHRLYVGAQKTATWDDNVDRLAISFDGEPVLLSAEEGAKWLSSALPTVTIVRNANTNAATIEAEGKFKITANVVPITEEESRIHHYGITADDCFAHIELGFKFFSLTSDVHGVLGQTYRDSYVSRVKMSSNMPIMGGEPKYAVSNLFSTDCQVARFRSGGKAAGGAAIMAAEKPVLSCESSLRGGHGIVCKR